MCELGSVDVIGFREDSAGRADFDHVGAIFVVQAHGVARFFRSIDNAFQRAGFMAEGPLPKAVLEIAVASGGADGMHGNEHPWAGDVAAANAIAKSDVEIISRADVAHGGEAGHQGDASIDGGIEGLLGDGFLQRVEPRLLIVLGVRKREMRMRVNEPREKRGVTEIDDLRAGGYGCAWANAGDFAAGDDHEAWRDNGIAFTIEEPSCLQDVSFFGRFLPLSHSRRPQHQATEQTA